MAEISDLSVVDANNIARFPEGMTIPAINNGARALEGIIARANRDRSGYTLTTGSGTAYAILTNSAYPAHAAGMWFLIRAHVASAGAATLTINALAAKPLRRQGGDPLQPNDILANQYLLVIYNPAGDYYECVGVGNSGAKRTIEPWVSLTCANGANTNLALPEGTNFYITGPTGAFTVSGLTNGVDGRLIRLYNSVAFALTIANDATSTTANRFLTLTGSDIVTTTQGAFTFVYSSTAQRWIQVGNQV